MSFKRIFYYFWQLIRQYKIAFFSQFLLVSGRVIFSNLIIGFIYKNIIDVLNQNDIPRQERYDVILVFILALGISFLTSMSMSRYGDYVQFRFVSRMIKDIYDFSFKKLLNHSYSFYLNTFAGSLVAKVKRFARAFEIANESLLNFWMLLVAVGGATFVLYFESPRIAGYFLAWASIYFIFVIFFVKQKIKLDLEESKADSKITGILSDVIANILNVKIFSSFKREYVSFQKTSTLVKDTIWASLKFSLLRSLFQASMMIAFHVFILYTMINLWVRGEISVGVFVMAYSFMIAVFDRIWDLSSVMAKFMKAMTDTKEIVDIFERKIEVEDKENPETLKMKRGVIEFRGVTFGYTEEVEVLSNFNLTIKEGEKVGIVGHSGSGKSTITKLLLRFLDVYSGEILIDGQNIAHVSQDDLRRVVSYVPQESILFHRSIEENIGYSTDNPTQADIQKAAKMAHALEFIEKLPKGYDTLVGERGVKLSGGERQRIAIARAMLKDSPVLILDEATSSLDSISEHYIQDAFNELMKGRTTIVIAHRLSTIQKMDRIIVLDKGAISEEGTHKELLANGGLYSELWNHQTGGFLEQ